VACSLLGKTGGLVEGENSIKEGEGDVVRVSTSG